MSYDLSKLVEELQKPEAYAEKPAEVDVLQTQISYVLRMDKYVYKIKKPLNLGYLDYSTLSRRLFFCKREVELNQRLAPEIYLSVVPITIDAGKIAVAGSGNTIEYAVKMRRMPEEAMMNVLVRNNRVSKDMVCRLVKKLVEFHKNANTDETIGAYGRTETIRRDTEENFEQTARYVGNTISREAFNHIRNYNNNFIKASQDLFNRRIAGRKIRDCHGDLRAEHICFMDEIQIYDCIEFNKRFRYCDIAAEIAFLAMDLDHYGRADISRYFVSNYIEQSGDRELPKLLNFYKCYRAYVRGKIESFKLDEPSFRKARKQELATEARSYFDLSSTYTRPGRFLLVTTGLSGTGKSCLAGELARRTASVVISSDIVRKEMASMKPTEHRFEEFEKGIYSQEYTERTYQELLDRARGLLEEGVSVIIDASFSKNKYRLNALKLARDRGIDFFLLDCFADEKLLEQRLKQRGKEQSVSDARLDILRKQREAYEPVEEIPKSQHIRIDTEGPFGGCIEKALKGIGQA